VFIAISGGSKLVRRHPGESSGPSNVLARQINRICIKGSESLASKRVKDSDPLIDADREFTL